MPTADVAPALKPALSSLLSRKARSTVSLAPRAHGWSGGTAPASPPAPRLPCVLSSIASCMSSSRPAMPAGVAKSGWKAEAATAASRPSQTEAAAWPGSTGASCPAEAGNAWSVQLAMAHNHSTSGIKPCSCRHDATSSGAPVADAAALSRHARTNRRGSRPPARRSAAERSIRKDAC
eukprot:scaffold7115_cov125-Isochrysis_galbana.AAC.4